jgi:hypothetical protein
MNMTADANGEFLDAAAQQVHFSEYRSQNWKRTHTDAYPDRRHELDRGNARLELAGMAGQNPTSRERAERHGDNDIRTCQQPERPAIASENVQVEMQT